MIFKYSIFQGLYNSDVHSKEDNWPNLVKLLTTHDMRTKKDGVLFSQAIYPPGSARGNAYVQGWSLGVVDFDNAHEGVPTTPIDQFDNFPNLTCAWYSTHSNTKEIPKWRLVFPFSRAVNVQEIDAIKAGFLHLLGNDLGIDKSCFDLSRAHFLPSCPPDQENAKFAGNYDGELLDPDYLIEMGSGFVPDNIQQRNQAPKAQGGLSEGRNNRLKAILADMLGRGESLEKIVQEVYLVDQQEHTTPLFSDHSKGYKSGPETGAIWFVAKIFRSINEKRIITGQPADLPSLSTPIIALGSSESAPLYKSTEPPPGEIPDFLLSPPGILKDIVEFYSRTARQQQPLLAVQTALSIGSIVAGRKYRTNKNNFSSLFFLNIAKSSSGKEHAKSVIDQTLNESGLGDLLSGAGYTSPGAIFSELLTRPAHITIIDEFGRLLEATQKQNNGHKEEAMTTLMEAFGRCHGTMRPTTYSRMTAQSDQPKKERKTIQNPAITLLGMTTPDVFNSSISTRHIQDGFLGRYLVAESQKPRQTDVEPDFEPVPQKIIDWVLATHTRHPENVTSMVPVFNHLTFEKSALDLIAEFNHELVEKMNSLDESGLSPLLGRTKEKAMRLSMITALAASPWTENISDVDIGWAIAYARFLDFALVTRSKRTMARTEHESEKKMILFALRDLGERGITRREMGRTPPFSGLKKRDLTEIIGVLVESGLAQEQKVRTGKPGNPRLAYVAINPKSVNA